MRLLLCAYGLGKTTGSPQRNLGHAEEDFSSTGSRASEKTAPQWPRKEGGSSPKVTTISSFSERWVTTIGWVQRKSFP